MQPSRSQILALPVDWVGATAKAEVNAVTMYCSGKIVKTITSVQITVIDSELPLLAGVLHTQKYLPSLGLSRGA
ncbi:MatE family protein [Aspergillus niger]|uniref:MatE family protein n=1 Tax=Aspergillus niger TaxID=5061 RepID=A0A505HRD9_ASPNG|nr:MatE family protein [Aspergillus niger]